jgi:hypothetical protein
LAGTGEDNPEELITRHVLDERLQPVYECLGSTPIDADGLLEHLNRPIEELNASLTLLELDGLAERVNGNCYILSRNATREKVNLLTYEPESSLLVAAILDFICSKFHGISRKYLQFYVALHWYYSAKSRWPRGSLLEACCRFRPVKYAEILAYVSPAVISLGTHSMSAT